MKKIAAPLILLLALCICSLASATTQSALPQEISEFFSGTSFQGAAIMDQANLSGTVSDDSWFVVIRTAGGENILYCFKQNNGDWKESFHTSNAVPQTKHGINVVVEKSGLDWTTDKPFAGPHLSIGEQNDEGEYWERTIIFELKGGKWLLYRYYSHYNDSSILFRDGSISYYKDYESDQIAGTATGEYQRDLRYVSLSAIPGTLKEAQASLTSAPDLPNSPELQVYPVNFTGAKKYDVYSAPDKSSVRGANGKARVSTNSWIQVFGTEGDWVLIQYSIDVSHYRFGYITSVSLPKKANVPALQFNKTNAWTVGTVSVTDDPLYSQSALTTLPEGSWVTWLATMGNWAYIESSTGDYVRGFVPVSSLHTNQQFDLQSIPMGDTPVLEGTLLLDPSSRTVNVHFRPISGGPLDGGSVDGFDVTDPMNRILFASLSEKDQDGYYSASFTIPAETTAIQIMALPSYGAIGDWGGAKAITVEW